MVCSCQIDLGVFAFLSFLAHNLWKWPTEAELFQHPVPLPPSNISRTNFHSGKGNMVVGCSYPVLLREILKAFLEDERSDQGQVKCQNQGCGVWVEAGVGVDRSWPFFLDSESELESVKLCRLRLRVEGYHPSTDNAFGRKVTHRAENIEKQEEKESGSERQFVGLNCQFVIKGLIKGICNNFGEITIVVWLCQHIQKLLYGAHSKEPGIPRSDAFAVSFNECALTASPVWIQSKWKSRKWPYHIALFRIENLLWGRSRNGVGLESESIF